MPQLVQAELMGKGRQAMFRGLTGIALACEEGRGRETKSGLVAASGLAVLMTSLTIQALKGDAVLAKFKVDDEDNLSSSQRAMPSLKHGGSRT